MEEDTLSARETLLGMVRGLDELPPLPHNTERLLDVLVDDDCDIAVIAGAIEEVPQLTARIVGLARSPFFGCAAQVRSVSDAIIRVLGTNLVKSLAVGIALSGPFRVERCASFSPRQYWSSSLLTASLARSLALAAAGDRAPDPESAYLCGLLHNLGLLALAHLAPELAADVFTTAAAEPERPLHRIENELLGTNHCEVGAYLAQRWHLPREVAVAIEHHHDAGYRGEHWPGACVVGLAAGWSRQRLAGIEQPWLDEKTVAALRIPADALAHAVAQSERRVSEVDEIARGLANG